MCTAFFLFGCHPRVRFLMVFNRDEFLDRETAAAAFWPDHPDILAGRDLKNGGTWCGVTRGGRFALLTNFREKDPGRVRGAPSRGALTLDFLRGGARPLEYLRGLELDRHNGFNLVVGDLSREEEGKMEVAYVTNRSSRAPSTAAEDAAAAAGTAANGAGTNPSSSSSPFPSGEPVLLPPGVYGLSNGVLGDSWCKVDRGVAILKGMLERGEFDDEGGGGGGDGGDGGENGNGGIGGKSVSSSSPSSSSSFPWDALFRSLMGDTSRAPAHLVPETGIPRHIEERLTPTFVAPFELLPKGGGGGGGGGGGSGGGGSEEASTAVAAVTAAASAETAAAELKKYGTRSQTALAVFAGGRAALRERRLVSWRERGGAAVAAGGEGGGGGGAGAAAAAAGTLPLPPLPPFKLEGCPIQSEWREVAHEFSVRSLLAEKEKEKEEEKEEGAEEGEEKRVEGEGEEQEEAGGSGGGAGAESERELVVDEAGECATAAAEEGDETELKASPP